MIDYVRQREQLLLMFILSQEVPINLWWPNKLGDQPLYLVQVQFVPESGSETSTKEVRIGFRTIELIQDPIPGQEG